MDTNRVEIICEYKDINYTVLRLLDKIGTEFEYVAAWHYDKEKGTWAQAHYFGYRKWADEYISSVYDIIFSDLNMLEDSHYEVVEYGDEDNGYSEDFVHIKSTSEYDKLDGWFEWVIGMHPALPDDASGIVVINGIEYHF